MSVLEFERLTQPELAKILADFRGARVGVIGDFALDVYWFVDPSASEPSLETGLPTRPVDTQRCELGGAGNVVNNLADLGCGLVEIFGVIGDDPWGREMRRLLETQQINTDALLVEKQNWATPAFVKPHLGGEETHRLDFGNFNKLPDATVEVLIERLRARIDELDILIINQQIKQGLHTAYLRERLAAFVRENPIRRFIVDSRDYSDAYPYAMLKINGREAARQIGADYPLGALVLKEHVLEAGRVLRDRMERPVLITRGARGVVVCDDKTHEIPGIQMIGKIDPVGAGDALLAGTALAMAVGVEPATAAALGNIVASITVKKLHQCGTATPEEVLAVGAQPDYVYRPELAEDVRQVQLIDDTEFEKVSDREPPARVSHVIFDHDGTISSLREGWERIMEPMMIHAVLGPQYESADDSLYHRVLTRVRDYIDKSTGIQTLVQMRGLSDMVREFGCVPEKEILDEHGYKKIYNEELMRLVRRRVDKLRRGELNVADYTVKNAVLLLRTLNRAGAKLYLASGTDQTDVVAEAEALGYADLFDGRIYGAVGDVDKDAKRMVLDRILNEIGTEADGLVAIGDGPVEIRETHKRGGYAIGVASDELRRFGLNEAKRTRLIHAGADLIIPDYSQLDALLRWLHIEA